MNTKLFALIAITALTVTLITTVTTSNAFARHHHHDSSNSQSLAQVNSCSSGSECQNVGSQVQGNGNAVNTIGVQ